jgi:hypothetical protein
MRLRHKYDGRGQKAKEAATGQRTRTRTAQTLHCAPVSRSRGTHGDMGGIRESNSSRWRWFSGSGTAISKSVLSSASSFTPRVIIRVCDTRGNPQEGEPYTKAVMGTEDCRTAKRCLGWARHCYLGSLAKKAGGRGRPRKHRPPALVAHGLVQQMGRVCITHLTHGHYREVRVLRSICSDDGNGSSRTTVPRAHGASTPSVRQRTCHAPLEPRHTIRAGPGRVILLKSPTEWRQARRKQEHTTVKHGRYRGQGGGGEPNQG